MPSEPGLIERMLREFQRALAERDLTQMEYMARRWMAVEQRLEAQYQALAEEVARRSTAGEAMSMSQVYQMERFKSLAGQALEETKNYQRWSATYIESGQEELAQAGIEQATELIRASYLEAGQVVARFDILPVEAVQAMAGYASDGTPLYELLMGSYPDSVERLVRALVQGTAQGINPRKTAVEMANAMGGNLERALRISRTEQVRAMRRASTEAMKFSGVVEGWYWRSALQERTCVACLAMDGSFHGLDEELNDHPCGRCFKQPAIMGLEPVQMQSGRDWFDQQDEALQRKMMGTGKYEAWKGGELRFEDLAKVSHSEEWGDMVVVN